MSFTYIKKTTLFAATLLAAFSIQSGPLFGVEIDGINHEFKLSDTVGTTITNISGISLQDMLEADGKLKTDTQKIWDDNIKTSKTVAKDILGYFFMTKVAGALIVKHAKTFFSDTNQLNTEVTPEAINNTINTGLTTICGNTANETYTKDGYSFTLTELDLDALIAETAKIMNNARTVLITVKAEIGTKGVAFFDYTDQIGRSVTKYIESILEKIATDINQHLTKLEENLRSFAQSIDTNIENAETARQNIPNGMNLAVAPKGLLMQIKNNAGADDLKAKQKKTVTTTGKTLLVQ